MKEEPSNWRTRRPCMTTALSSCRYTLNSPHQNGSPSLLQRFTAMPSNSLFCRDKELKKTSQKLSSSWRKQWIRFQMARLNPSLINELLFSNFPLVSSSSPPAGFCSRHQCAGLVLRAVRAGLQACGGAVGAGRPPPEPRCRSESGHRALAGSVSGKSRRQGTITCPLKRCQVSSRSLQGNHLSLSQFMAYKYYMKAAERGHIRGALSLAEVWTTGIAGRVIRRPADAVL